MEKCVYCGSEDIQQLADNEAVCRRCQPAAEPLTR